MPPEIFLVLSIQVCGVTLVMFGTLTMYTAFAISLRSGQYADRVYAEPSEHPLYGALPVISDAFREWPLAGGFTTGLGVTFMTSGTTCAVLMRSGWMECKGTLFQCWKMVVFSSMVAQASVWGVILSSDTGLNAVNRWVHNVSTFFLMVSVATSLWLSLLVLHPFCEKANDQERKDIALGTDKPPGSWAGLLQEKPKEEAQKELKSVDQTVSEGAQPLPPAISKGDKTQDCTLLLRVHRAALWGLLPLSVCGIGISGFSVFLAWLMDGAPALKTALAVGELLFVAAAGSGFWAVVYLYWQLELRAMARAGQK